MNKQHTKKYYYLYRGLLILILFISNITISCVQQNKESSYLPTSSDTLNIPAITGPLIIDGKLNDTIWQSARILPLTNIENNFFGQGGEAYIAVSGDYLCLSARLPESDRLVTRSTGINPIWWQEDMIVWRLRYQSPKDRMSVTIAVNALGAISLYAGDYNHYQRISDDVINSTGTPIDWASDIFAAALIEHEDWTVELAIPLEQLGPIGFMSLERVRAVRPYVPELSWYFPAPNERAYYEMATVNQEPSPTLRATALPQNRIIKEPETPDCSMAREVAALPKQAWTREEQESLGISSMLENSIRKRMARFAEEEKLAWREVRTVDDWESFRDKRLTAMRNRIGTLPERIPMRPTITRRSNYGDGFVIENIVYESRPNFIVTANLTFKEDEGHPSLPDWLSKEV